PDDADRVEEAPVHHLHTHDGAVLRLDVLLEQRGPVGPEVQPLRRRLEVHARVEPLDERPGAADAGLDQHREAEARARLDELGAVVHDDRRRIREAKPLEELHLERLGLLEPVGRHGIDHRDPERFVVAQERLGVEEHARVAAAVRRRARAVHDDGVAPPAVARIVAVVGVVDLLERQPPPLELGDEASRAQSTRPWLSDAHSCPVTTANEDATPRRVSGIPAYAGAAMAEVTPGTTSNGIRARASASASSPPRPKTKGSPPLSLTTRRPRRA